MHSAILLSAKLLELHMFRCRATTHFLDSLECSATTVAAGDDPSKIRICVQQSLCCNLYVCVGRLGCSDSCLQLCSQGMLSMSLWPVLSCRSSKQLCSGRQSISTSMSRQAGICNKNMLAHITSPLHNMMLMPCRESNNVLLLLWQLPCLSFKTSCQCLCRSLHAQSCPDVSFALDSVYAQLCVSASEMHYCLPHRYVTT